MTLIAEKEIGAMGRIVIPEEVRGLCNMGVGQKVLLSTDGSRVLLQVKDGSSPNDCFLCGKPTEEAIWVKDKRVCAECVTVCAESYKPTGE